MCGIAGIVKLGNEPITSEQIVNMFLGIEHRGGDATGIAMMTGDKLTWHKEDKIAWRYVLTDGFKKYLKENLKPETQTVLLHTRAWTVGSPHKNVNNHPLTVGTCAAVHNGGISNHADLFKELNLKREAETDSDIIRAIVDKEGITKKAIRTLGRMRGSCASAIIHKDSPRKILLMRSGSPLVIGVTQNQLMWASTQDAIYEASRIYRKRWGIWVKANRTDLKFSTVQDNSAWILDLDEMQNNTENPDFEPWHDKFDICYHYTAPNYDIHNRYKEKLERKEKEQLEEQRKAATSAASAATKLLPAINLGTVIEGKKDDTKEIVIIPELTANKMKDENSAQGTYAVCRNQKCSAVLEIPEAAKDIPMHRLACEKCNVVLALPESYFSTAVN